MIQSGKFDSPNMNIKKIANSLLIFITNKIIEIIGILVSIFGILLLIALLSYSPSDPNFIFSDNTEIKNLLGFQGSYISDFFFQAFGIISFLIPLTYFLSGIKVVKEKKIFFLIENTFYTIIYSILGALFFTYFYNDAFYLYINGNGGFVGSYLSQISFKSDTIPYENIIYYIFSNSFNLFFIWDKSHKRKENFFLN